MQSHFKQNMMRNLCCAPRITISSFTPTSDARRLASHLLGLSDLTLDASLTVPVRKLKILHPQSPLSTPKPAHTIHIPTNALMVSWTQCHSQWKKPKGLFKTLTVIKRWVLITITPTCSKTVHPSLHILSISYSPTPSRKDASPATGNLQWLPPSSEKDSGMIP